jgi:hypothetical protein
MYHIEAAVKISAFGMYFFKENWNIFDFLVLILTDLSLFVAFLINTDQL